MGFWMSHLVFRLNNNFANLITKSRIYYRMISNLVSNSVTQRRQWLTNEGWGSLLAETISILSRGTGIIARIFTFLSTSYPHLKDNFNWSCKPNVMFLSVTHILKDNLSVASIICNNTQSRSFRYRRNGSSTFIFTAVSSSFHFSVESCAV